MHRRKQLLRQAGPLGLVLLAGTLAWGQTPAPLLAPAAGSAGASPQTIMEELKALTDPTIMSRRVWLETEFNQYKDNSQVVEETLGGVWAWRVSADQDWGVRFILPYDWRVAGDAAGDDDEQGLGDLKLATGTALRLSPKLRAAGGLELRLPTAADNLGGHDWRLQEFGAVAWDATPWFTPSPSFEYNQSLAEVGAGLPQHYLELFFPATFLLPHAWSVTPQYELKTDFEQDNALTQSAKLQLGKQLAHLPLGFGLSIKRPFAGSSKQFQVNFSVKYYFR